MKINFVSEFISIQRYCRNNALPPRERLLWIALFTIANDRAIYNENAGEYEWEEGFIPVPNGELTLYSTLDKRGIESVRNALKQRGVLDFVPGNRNRSVPLYKLNYLSPKVGCKTVPNDVPTNDTSIVSSIVPNDVPTNDTSLTPLYKLNKGEDKDGVNQPSPARQLIGGYTVWDGQGELDITHLLRFRLETGYDPDTVLKAYDQLRKFCAEHPPRNIRTVPMAAKLLDNILYELTPEEDAFPC